MKIYPALSSSGERFEKSVFLYFVFVEWLGEFEECPFVEPLVTK
jgi:hypothetical protein